MLFLNGKPPWCVVVFIQIQKTCIFFGLFWSRFRFIHWIFIAFLYRVVSLSVVYYSICMCKNNNYLFIILSVQENQEGRKLNYMHGRVLSCKLFYLVVWCDGGRKKNVGVGFVKLNVFAETLIRLYRVVQF